ncbi:hypothetical protein DHEL01_v203156 [Diaporthe helianthi]|uniref:Uncharacterized protein n=1 Tax=Diaporthe helianthi TaxID=158607 RepID=A0A2P5I7I0_DIAHE|nr:hypothetical protein DHEL01_v203156 [Diaporthe helianthi]
MPIYALSPTCTVVSCQPLPPPGLPSISSPLGEDGQDGQAGRRAGGQTSEHGAVAAHKLRRRGTVPNMPQPP